MPKETSIYFWKKHIKRRRNFKRKLVKEVDKTYTNIQILKLVSFLDKQRGII